MLDNSGDQSDGNSSSSHTLSTEPLRLQQQLNTAPNHGTHSEEKELDAEKGMSNGENGDASAATEKLEARKPAQNPAAMPNEKDKDPNLVGWDGMVFLRVQI